MLAWFTANADSALTLGYSRRVDVGSIAKVSEKHAASIFRVKDLFVLIYSYVWGPRKPKRIKVAAATPEIRLPAHCFYWPTPQFLMSEKYIHIKSTRNTSFKPDDESSMDLPKRRQHCQHQHATSTQEQITRWYRKVPIPLLL
jgi:hypothetical protein